MAIRDTCDGLVIRECAYGESDKLLTVLTADRGQLVMIAKGARSTKSKVMCLCHLFTYANFEFYEKNGRRWISGGAVNDSFFGLNSDITGFALASYLVQLAAEISGEGVPAERVLRMTLNSLYAIQNSLKPLPLIKSAYEIFAVEESGFSPDVSGCAECDAESFSDGWLDVMNGRVLCEDCLSKQGGAERVPATDRFMTQTILTPFSGEALAAWRYVASAPLKRIFSFSLSSQGQELLSRATEAYLVNHLERSFETLEFYNMVKD